MTYDEFTICEIADAIRERRKWELCCEGCKHLRDSKWCIADREGKTYYCSHPDRQDGFHDPHHMDATGIVTKENSFGYEK